MNLMERAAECGIPAYMHKGLMMYFIHGIEPGSFLTAVICNDLRGAVGAADQNNIGRLPNYVDFFYNHAPAQSWGSPERMHAWMEEKNKLQTTEAENL